jgi:acyl-CoA hydrolase
MRADDDYSASIAARTVSTSAHPRAIENPLAEDAGRVAETRLVMSQLMQPADANFMGVIHGGAVVKLIDEAAAACAFRFCRRRVVTVSIDRIDFHYPVAIGSLLTLKSTINHAGNASLEVGVHVETEDLSSGKVVHTNSAHLVFVALDSLGKPTRVPRLIAESEEEKRRWREAEARQSHRRKLREAVA